ncbi:MAG: M20/M25/M40 family metallo-hydrolase [Pyrinomonadaceae bacterium]|nr:M20/M25/M40 family metallo-hydrolase [Pyrinomonadaceae bacterium]MCX7639759.1 M20/M25/M40 family metallo-hydrolase [Pyrinomonadaceae bacterium]MDW8304342.1 M20/M25/M40 family metallo-hydrolase [Acidobacteriota bacterium]
MFRKSISLVLLLALFSPSFAFVGEIFVPDEATIQKIKDEGMNRSQVMQVARYLTDVIGPRLTNSPGQRRASLWTKEQFEKWGLKNVTLDDWGEFGRGWELKKFYAAIQTPDEYIVFRSYPKAWSPSISITSEVIFVDAKNEQELEQYKGKLKGKIVFTTSPVEIKPGFNPVASRRSDEELAKMESAKTPEMQEPRRPTQQQMGQFQFNTRKLRFYFEEGAAVLVEPSSSTDSGTIRVMGASPYPSQGQPNPFGGVRVYSKNAQPTIPQIVAEVEQYNRICRLLKQGIPVTMTVNLEAKFYEDDLRGYNTIAEIPGTDLKDEVVMLGAHLDSWHAGTGATDNAAGSAVVMEAVRILQAIGLKPRRTIRVALWTGEEQGLLGSRGYVAKNFATIGDGSDSSAMQAMMGGVVSRQINKKADYDKISAYYNLDNGTGQIRGIFLQGNEALRPIFKKWFEPFKDWGASTVTINSTGGTDHLAFDAVGIPGFQFIQDPIEYFARTWHTTQDVSDRLIEEDLKRSAVIMATFVYNTAMMDEKLPRKPMEQSSFFRIFDVQSELEKLAFRNSRLNHSICGHLVEHEEIPDVFPSFLTVGFLYEPLEHAHYTD